MLPTWRILSPQLNNPPFYYAYVGRLYDLGIAIILSFPPPPPVLDPHLFRFPFPRLLAHRNLLPLSLYLSLSPSLSPFCLAHCVLQQAHDEQHERVCGGGSGVKGNLQVPLR